MRPFLLALCVLLAATLCCKAQTYAYANEREHCSYNSRTEKFDICDTWEDHTLFIIQEDETRFEHITDKIRSMYFVDSKEWNEDMGMTLWNVSSNTGNQYTYVLNLENNVIVALYDNGEESFIVTFTIKKYWKQ